MVGVTQWRCLCVDCIRLLAHVGVAQNPKPLSVGGHKAVFDPVVDHLDKMPGAVWTAVQVTLFGGALKLLASRRARYITRARRQRREGWIEVLDHVPFATNHHAVAALEAPHTTACPHVHIV